LRRSFNLDILLASDALNLLQRRAAASVCSCVDTQSHCEHQFGGFAHIHIDSHTRTILIALHLCLGQSSVGFHSALALLTSRVASCDNRVQRCFLGFSHDDQGTLICVGMSVYGFRTTAVSKLIPTYPASMSPLHRLRISAEPWHQHLHINVMGSIFGTALRRRTSK